MLTYRLKLLVSSLDFTYVAIKEQLKQKEKESD